MNFDPQSPDSSPPPTRTSLREWVDALQAKGAYTFLRSEAQRVTGLAPGSMTVALNRLVKAGRIVSPHREFFVIVPLEYSLQGALPPSWFLDPLMSYLGMDYYVALLSAAALHGAAHQQPQAFQAMTVRPLRPAQAGTYRIQFFCKKKLPECAFERVKTETGTFRVSTPETTALDLVAYARQAGGLSHVATVLAELGEALRPEKLEEAARIAEPPTIQRLGFLLEQVGHGAIAACLEDQARVRRTHIVPLRRERPRAGAEKNARWGLWINDVIEVDS